MKISLGYILTILLTFAFLIAGMLFVEDYQRLRDENLRLRTQNLSYDGDIFSRDSTFTILFGDSAFYYEGKPFGLKVYNRALTPDEIKQIMDKYKEKDNE